MNNTPINQSLVKFILIEDNDDESHLLRLWLTKLRSAQDVLVVDSIQAAVCALERIPAPAVSVKLIITDYKLGDCTALDLLQILKNDSRYKGIPVVVWSSATLKDISLAVQEAGAQEFLVKPVGAQESRELLSRLLKG